MGRNKMENKYDAVQTVPTLIDRRDKTNTSYARVYMTARFPGLVWAFK